MTTKIPNRPSMSAYATDRGWEVRIKGQSYVALKCEGLLTTLNSLGRDEWGNPMKDSEGNVIIKRGRGRPSKESQVKTQLIVEPAPFLGTGILLTEPAPSTKEEDEEKGDEEPKKEETGDTAGSSQVLLTEDEE